MSKTSGLAIASLVFGILSVLAGWISYFGLIVIVPSLVCGILALRTISKNKNAKGKGLAIAGIMLGSIGLLIQLIILSFFVYNTFVLDYENKVYLGTTQEVTKEGLEESLGIVKSRVYFYGASISKPHIENNQIVFGIPEISVGDREILEGLIQPLKFEARIGNTTIFMGGRDITYVCRSSECSGISPREPCGIGADNQWVCRFRFSIELSPEASQRQADATRNLEVISTDGQQYLSQKVNFYLDDVLVDSLNIGADLKGKEVRDIEISGSGTGLTRDDAILDALRNMKKLQVALFSMPLPYSLTISEIRKG